jgi:hypothetical protein
MLLRSATQARQQAESTHEFISRHIAAVYELGDGCQVDVATGVITRPVAPATPALVKEEGEAETA